MVAIRSEWQCKVTLSVFNTQLTEKVLMIDVIPNGRRLWVKQFYFEQDKFTLYSLKSVAIGVY